MTADLALRTGAALASALAASALAAAGLWRCARSRMQRERWMRANYRGERIIAVSGLLVVAIGATVSVGVAVFAYRSTGWFAYYSVQIDESRWVDTIWELLPDDGFRNPAMASATGALAAALALAVFGLLGYRDDVRGDDEAGGFAAHIADSWRQRRLTTGAQKALGGGAAAILCVQMALFGNVASLWSSHGWSDGTAIVRSLQDLLVGTHEGWSVVPLLRGALIVALGANMLNLFDRMPGRATKVALAWWLLALVPASLFSSAWSPGPYETSTGSGWFEWHSAALWAAGAVGASVGLLGSEMREEHMLGDTGVNPVGAVLGMATVVAYSAAVEWVVLAILAVLNLASERWSFSRIIDAVPPLRWLDRLGSPYRN
ncbi:hypothetical protein [Candidatus Poriferisodalis multihospitum]|uniref:hypothetical protein n=1 Tax=Candidatus Poriferisodalis multihospitum TaxID=2983191 RepID=UPI002B25E229|nr:hypothetical protein [Candidatus Poriferisodalis multihospitum]